MSACACLHAFCHCTIFFSLFQLPCFLFSNVFPHPYPLICGAFSVFPVSELPRAFSSPHGRQNNTCARRRGNTTTGRAVGLCIRSDFWYKVAKKLERRPNKCFVVVRKANGKSQGKAPPTLRLQVPGQGSKRLCSHSGRMGEIKVRSCGAVGSAAERVIQSVSALKASH